MKKLLKGYIIKWLDERALRLPQSVREKIADRLKVDVALIHAIEEAIREEIINQVKSW